MNLRDLEYLVALDEHRHFGRAAAACFVSQPTLSTQVKKLEHELGVDLVERGNRTVMLTAAGDEVAARARVMLAEAQDIRGIAKRARNPRSGTLTLGVFPTLAPYLLPHVIPTLHARLPELRLRLVEDRSRTLLDDLHAGRIDAAVLALPVLECDDPHQPTAASGAGARSISCSSARNHSTRSRNSCSCSNNAAASSPAYASFTSRTESNQSSAIPSANHSVWCAIAGFCR